MTAESLRELGVSTAAEPAGHPHLGHLTLFLEGERHMLILQPPDGPDHGLTANFGRYSSSSAAGPLTVTATSIAFMTFSIRGLAGVNSGPRRASGPAGAAPQGGDQGQAPVQAAITIHPPDGQLPLPAAVWFAWTSQ